MRCNSVDILCRPFLDHFRQLDRFFDLFQRTALFSCLGEVMPKTGQAISCDGGPNGNELSRARIEPK